MHPHCVLLFFVLLFLYTSAYVYINKHTHSLSPTLCYATTLSPTTTQSHIHSLTHTHTHTQESQVTIQCVIESKHHRSIMGPKGSNVQGITQDHDVSIKFPDREKHNSQSAVPNGDGGAPPTDASVAPPTADGDAPAVNGDDEESEPVINPRHVIIITGRKENAEAAKQALMVRHFVYMLLCCVCVRVRERERERESE